MRIGLIDVDNGYAPTGCFPNLALMKISAWHKARGDEVEWYHPMFTDPVDRCYMSKVFSFSAEPDWYIDAKQIIRGGTGYCIHLEDGKEVFDQSKNRNLPEEIEHVYPDYSLYGISNTAYGFCSRGCPRGCGFCHVAPKEGKCSVKVADLREFWHGQKYIELCDPNLLACKDWEDIMNQLIQSKAWVNFNQGLDIRLLDGRKAELLKQVKIKKVHFAYDTMKNANVIERNLITLKTATGWTRNRVSVYCLCNFDTTMEENLHRIYFLRSLDFQPYVMLYNKKSLKRGHELLRLQRWVNNPFVFWKCSTFEEYRRIDPRQCG